MPDIPADAGAGHGCFEDLHDFPDGRTFAKALKERAAKYYGTAVVTFIEQLTEHHEDIPQSIRQARDQFVDEVIGHLENVAPPVGRVADRFGLVAAAGELATAFGITGWEPHEAERAVKRCFVDWLEARGGPGNIEEERITAKVRAFIETNGDAQFADWERAERGDEHRPKTSMMAGFARYRNEPRNTVWYVFTDRFRNDVVRPYSYRDAERVLAQARWLKMSGDKPPRPTRNERLPMHGKRRCYVLELPDDGED
jgi:uncharacterized protein (DUF927 family)